jgi:hypothetical protein
MVVTVTNPESSRLRVVATLGPGKQITMDKRGGAWVAQAFNPASARIVEQST